MVGATGNHLFIAAVIMAAVTTTGWADSQNWSAPNGAHPSQYLAGLWDACNQRDAALVAVNSTDVSPGLPTQLEEGQAIIEYEWVSDLWDTVLALIPYYLNHTVEATWDDSSTLAGVWSQSSLNTSAGITAPDKPAVNNWVADAEWMTYLYEVLNRLLWIRNDFDVTESATYDPVADIGPDPWSTAGTEKVGQGNERAGYIDSVLYCPEWAESRDVADTAWTADTPSSPPARIGVSSPAQSFYGPGSFTWGVVSPYGNPVPCDDWRVWRARKENRIGKFTPPSAYGGFDITSNYYLKAEAVIGTAIHPYFNPGQRDFGSEDDVYDRQNEDFTTAGNYYLFSEAPSSEVTVGDNDEPPWCNEPSGYDPPWPEDYSVHAFSFSSRGWIATDTYAVVKFDGDDGFTHTA